LKELNQRLVTPDYETMLNKYDVFRENDVKKQEDEDEAFVKSIFGNKDGGAVIKRIEEEDSSEDETKPPKKVFKMDVKLATDILTTDVKPTADEIKKASLKIQEKSIGIMKINKNSLVMVKPKPISKPQESAAASTVVKIESDCSVQSSTNSLGLLGGYGSDSGADSE